MQKMIITDIVNILKKEVVPAMGCTEPVAIALASSYAISGLEGKINKISLRISSNVYKNAKAVGIPGTDHTGIEMAIALGASIGEPDYDLTILSKLTPRDIQNSLALVNDTLIDLKILYDTPNMYIDVEILMENGEFGKSIIQDYHTNLVYLQKNDSIKIDRTQESFSDNTDNVDLLNYPLKTIIENTLKIPYEEIEFLLEGIKLNMEMAEVGLKMEQGMSIGKSWKNILDKGFLTNGLSNEITMYTTAACVARMSGIELPVMTSSGSGNNGIIAVIPISIVAKHLGASMEKTAYALAVSHIVNSNVKKYVGRLSPVCGCGVSAGAGAGAGIVYLLGGGLDEIEKAIVNVVSSLAGMICDGGKVGCALKLSASASMAWQSALFAMEGVCVPSGNGIVGITLDDTLKNLGLISKEGMCNVDRAVISTM
ncbi:MAG: L-serine ammonia-lyase, iron-sulfur-dependent, subunit alpha [Dethiosulfatibacter sp.]|nr:L-serine ammonia-lyase, iron-sulfur-dependent, subunit alpha [Dethiosulfatibacter sp.]